MKLSGCYAFGAYTIVDQEMLQKKYTGKGYSISTPAVQVDCSRNGCLKTAVNNFPRHILDTFVHVHSD